MLKKIKTKLKNLDALDRMIIALIVIIAIWKFVYGEVNLDWLNSNIKEEKVEIVTNRNKQEDN
jgi:hypothetical protein